MKKIFLLLAALISTLAIEAQQADKCISGNCRDGYGTMVTADGERYIGHFENFKREGQGVYFFANGNKYVGTWKAGLFDGEGRVYYKDGKVRGGLWKEGQYVEAKLAGCIAGDCENGYGVYLYEDGTKYMGSFASSKPTKQAAVFFTNGDKYIGSWVDAQMNGQGTLYKGDGAIEEGIWRENEFRGESKAAKGCVDGNCDNGDGVYVYPDNTRYEGEFKKGLAHGKGICFYADGDQYHGEWRFHTFDGHGTMYLTNGTILKGNWRAGEYLGGKLRATASEPKTQPKVWALLVGVARYNHMKSLKFTDDDAYRMYAFLKSPEGGALPDEQIKVLIDEDATKENILTAMDKIFNQANENDIVLFYFSGHGLKGSFLPSDYDGENYKLEHSEILSRLAQCPAKGKVVIADACHSGSLQDEMMASSKGNVQTVIESYYDAFNASSGGTALMLSSKAEETSIENNGLRQGIFSHFLIRGLKGAADHNNDKLINIGELFGYIEANVKYYTNNYQTPIITGNYDKAMPLGVVR